ncbi:PhzF family phenazine biosynthesis protein [Chitinibacter sp. S2-10]|uniref:PhzF family phenazine biosynthesis protein n=1 Tax=Chitinibacter sp. S2-10 TaxID=3373597 RepID=UPI003977D155
MTAYPFFLTSVFAEKTWAGDPLIVFDVPDWPDEATLQMMAYQMNASEVAFLHRASGEVRFYHPQFSLPFSAKGLLGAAAVMQQSNSETRFKLHCLSGHYSLLFANGSIDLQCVAGCTRPSIRGQVDIAYALGIESHAIIAPLQLVDTGLEQLMVQVRSRQVVLQARPHPALLADYAQSPKQVAQAVIWHREGDLITMRSFIADHFNIYENFGDGTAALNLATGYLAGGARLPFDVRIEQGHTIERILSRLSILFLQIDNKLDLHLKAKVSLLGSGVLQV